MTNISITFTQDHPNNIQAVSQIAQSTSFSIPIKINFVNLLRKIPAAFNKGLIADIYLLLTSPTANVSKTSQDRKSI